MIRVACPNCETKYRFDVGQLKGKARARARCKNCGGPIEINAADVSPETTMPSVEEPAQAVAQSVQEEPRHDTTARVRRLRSDQDLPGDPTEKTMSGQEVVENLDLPPDKKYSLAVLQGNASGQIFNISSSRTTIGRAGCDIVLDDPECSRQHAVLEIVGARAAVADLGSTNGTFIDGKRIDRAVLENHSEFRVGDHVLMLIVTDRE